MDLKDANDGLAEGGKICTVLPHCRIVNCASPVSTISVVLDTYVENEGARSGGRNVKCGKMQIGDCVHGHGSHVWKGYMCVYGIC